ncbi:melanization protease 1 [Manduca sexta]|uniref:Hemolymph proteinase 10 n=1 Tax=Manduca sexta TaxID=7130 RepID=Q5MPC4_MANSE|nr:melanization protease 1 [Manduca sexta]AAV91008.1 hemolymph proteinase 10 [Manduca sexta]KAG6464793.1 hypothetical protein O3G_MSEX014734 [Manduca sexta]KAG6464794.1 hypothetical protein O3G_MSEX014734 [Manduca sexta]
MFCYKSLFLGVVIVAVEAISFNKLENPKCGVEASSNLVHQNPWLGYLEYYRHGNIVEVRCGATLIGPRHVVTAAHCVKKIRFSSIAVRLGEYDLESNPDCVRDICTDPVVRIEVDDIFVHPDYDGKEHDIAVLRLKEDAPYTDFIRPICLPSGYLEDNVIFSAAGFGEIPLSGMYTKVKKIIPLPNWDVAECRAAYQDIVLPQKIICAGGKLGEDTCRGDSGGPLVWFRETAQLWGVTSLGNVHCGTKGYPGVYTSVLDYLEWIETTVMI